jgi:hypothetical protein
VERPGGASSGRWTGVGDLDANAVTRQGWHLASPGITDPAFFYSAATIADLVTQINTNEYQVTPMTAASLRRGVRAARWTAPGAAGSSGGDSQGLRETAAPARTLCIEPRLTSPPRNASAGRRANDRLHPVHSCRSRRHSCALGERPPG